MKKRSGFTLVELLIVLVIAVIVMAVVVTKMKSYSSVKLYNVARRLSADMQYAQSLAESTQKTYRITFYPPTDNYMVTLGTGTAVPDQLTKKPMIRDFTKSSEFKNINIQLAEFPEGTEYVEFNPMGVVSHSGRIVLSYETESYEIYVDTYMGHVTLTKLP
jgi:type II secretion system protein H